MTALTIQQTKTKDALLVTLAGAIDESVDYTVIDLKGSSKIVFDFEGVKLVNSTGLQRWIKFLSGTPTGADLSFSKCSIRVITQINMFPGFLGGRPVKIESFYAPYFCEACDSSCDILLDTARDFKDPTAPKAPKMQCPKCKGPAEFDGIEKKYFLFLKP